MYQISVLFPMDIIKKVEKTQTTTLNTSPDDETPTREGTSPCMVTILNLGSAFGFVPFRITLNDSTGRYEILQLHILRRILCALIHATVFFMYSGFNQDVQVLTRPKDLSSNFIQTFDFVSTIGTVMLMGLFCYTFWKRQDELLKILDETKVKFDARTERTLKAISVIIFLMAYASSNYIHRNYIEDVTHVDYASAFSTDESPESIILTVGKMILDTYVHHALSMTYFSYTVISMIGLTMRGVRKDFHEKMSVTLVTMDVKTGFDHYMALKELISDITATFGNHILVYYIISVAYFAKIPESSVWHRYVETLAMIVYFAMGTLIWIISAEFHMDVRDVVQNWATQMQDLDDVSVDTRIRLLSVVNDNLLDPIGVSCKFFTITYGFLGSMLGLIVTYAIIVFQMQTKPQATSITTQISNVIMGTMFPPAATTPSAN